MKKFVPKAPKVSVFFIVVICIGVFLVTVCVCVGLPKKETYQKTYYLIGTYADTAEKADTIADVFQENNGAGVIVQPPSYTYFIIAEITTSKQTTYANKLMYGLSTQILEISPKIVNTLLVSEKEIYLQKQLLSICYQTYTFLTETNWENVGYKQMHTFWQQMVKSLQTWLISGVQYETFYETSKDIEKALAYAKQETQASMANNYNEKPIDMYASVVEFFTYYLF